MNKSKNQSIKVINVMSDGTVRDSLKGFVIPRNEHTEMFYEIIARVEARESLKVVD